MARNTKQKRLFIHQLAKYINQNSIEKSLQISVGSPLQQKWALVRSCSPVFGHITMDEAEAALLSYFDVEG